MTSLHHPNDMAYGARAGQQRSVGTLTRLAWLWSCSRTICGGSGPVLAARRVLFIVRAAQARKELSRMMAAPSRSPMGRHLEKRPETVGAVLWPYKCSGWDVPTRLRRIFEHYEVIETQTTALDFDVDSQVVLVDLGSIFDGPSRRDRSAKVVHARGTTRHESLYR